MMSFTRVFFSLLLLGLLVAPGPVFATHFSSLIRGRILLDVEESGEAWYVYPPTMERYYMGRPTDAFTIMRELGLGITDRDLEGIPTSEMNTIGDLALRNRLSGLVLLQVEQNGEAWYVYPEDVRRYFLGRPDDAFQIMGGLGLGISSANLAHIPIADTSLQLPPEVAGQQSIASFTLTNSRGSFPVSVITLDRDAYEMITDTAESEDCKKDCGAEPLEAYVNEHDAFAGIHGTYFCPPDYAPCQDEINSYLPPVFNTSLDRMINEDTLRFHNRPMIASATDGTLLYFHRATTFGDSVAEFEDRYGVELQAAIGNWPSLVENGVSIVADEPSEDAFLLKATRGGIGWNDDFFFLVVAERANMEDLASIFVSLDAAYAMNLDGGGSAALYYNNAYRVGPGRELPNAVLFRPR